jgi:hypothetical protein
MIIKNAAIEDIEQIMVLQEKYLVANMPESIRTNGFVTTAFTVAQITEVIEQHGLVIAIHENQVVAYAFGASWAFFCQWPIFAFMVSTFENLVFEGHQISTENSFQYGPICVDESQRGSGLFEKMYAAIKETMAARYPLGVTFINKINERSFAAHTKKLQMAVISEFEFNQNQYYTLAFETKKSPNS